MFPFFNSPDSTLPELPPEVSNCCCETNRLRAGLPLGHASDREDECAGKYSTCTSLGTPTLALPSKRDPFRPSDCKRQRETEEQDEDRTAHWNAPQHALGALLSAGAVPSLPCSKLVGLQIPQGVPKAAGCYPVHIPQAQKTILDKLFCKVQGWISLVQDTRINWTGLSS